MAGVIPPALVGSEGNVKDRSLRQLLQQLILLQKFPGHALDGFTADIDPGI